MPKDDEEDYTFPVWAGVIPISLTVNPPESDPRNLLGLEAPEHAKSFKIG